MSRDEVAAESVGRKETRLEVDQVADLEVAEVGEPEGFGEEIEGGPVAGRVGDRQAAAIVGDAIAGFGGGEKGRLDREPQTTQGSGSEFDDATGGMDETREHAWK